MIFQAVLNFILHLYVLLLSSLFFLVYLDKTSLENSPFSILIIIGIQSPYLYYYLYKDSENYLHGAITEGNIVLFLIFLYFYEGPEKFGENCKTVTLLALPLLIIIFRRWLSESDTCSSLPRFISWLLCRPLEETLAIIKPDGLCHKDEIMNVLYDNGFTIVSAKEEILPTHVVARLYSDKLEESYYPELQDHMISGNVYIMRLSHPRAVSKLKEIVGPADVKIAQKEEKYKNTVRSKFGTNIHKNVIHASNSKKSAKKEIDMFWSIKEQNSLDKNGGIDEEQKERQDSKEIPKEEKVVTIGTIPKFFRRILEQDVNDKPFQEELNKEIQNTVYWAQENFNVIEKLIKDEKKSREQSFNAIQKSLDTVTGKTPTNLTQESMQAIENQVVVEAKRLKAELNDEIQNTETWVRENIEAIQQELKKNENSLLELEQSFTNYKMNASSSNVNGILGNTKNSTMGSGLYAFVLLLGFLIAVFSFCYSKLKSQNEKLTKDFISLAERYKNLELVVDSIKRRNDINDNDNNDLNMDD